MNRDGLTWWFAGGFGSLAVLAACSGGGASVGSNDLGATDTENDAADAGTEAAVDPSGDPPPPKDGGITDSGPSITNASLYCGVNRQVFNATLSLTSMAAWTCTSTTRSLASNGIPDHAPGTFPNPDCPNTIKAQTITASMPYAPAVTATVKRPQIVGYAVNGVKLEPGTGGTCSVSGGTVSCSLAGNGGEWRIEALGQTTFDFGVDSSNAHVQPTGEYHYHGMPTGLMSALGQAQDMKLVAFALDGFPIYTRYGYSIANDATSALKTLTGSYKVKSSPDPNRPSTTDYPMGVFVQDWEYSAGLGDLDECNGRTGVTPDFPGGTYYYVITDTYPFIGRCLKGTPGTSSSGSTGGGGTGGGDGGLPPPDGGKPPPDGGPPPPPPGGP